MFNKLYSEARIFDNGRDRFELFKEILTDESGDRPKIVDFNTTSDGFVEIQYLDQVFLLMPVHAFKRERYKLEITLFHVPDESCLDPVAKLFMDHEGTSIYYEIPVIDPNSISPHFKLDGNPHNRVNFRNWLFEKIGEFLLQDSAKTESDEL